MPRVFVSYRRDDSRREVERLYADLAREFGEESLFKDLSEKSPHGEDYRETLRRELEASSLALVVIGKQWLSPRLEEPDDAVRAEVAFALEHHDAVIPVLLHDTPMPTHRELPDAIGELAYRQAARLRGDPDYAHDRERLARSLERGGLGALGWHPRKVLVVLALTVATSAIPIAWWMTFVEGDGTPTVAAALTSLLGPVALIAVALAAWTFARGSARRLRFAVAHHLDGSTIALSLALVGVLAATCAVGAIRVVADTTAREVSLTRGEETRRLTVPAGEDIVSLWSTWSDEPVVVSTTGYVDTAAEVRVWDTTTLGIPVDFLAPVVLLRCDSLFFADTAARGLDGARFVLRLHVGDEAPRDLAFDGSTVSIGRAIDPSVLQHRRAAWDEELAAIRARIAAADGESAGRDHALALGEVWRRLGPPLALPLAVGQTIAAEVVIVRGADERVVGRARRSAVVDPTLSFPQVLPLVFE